MIDARLVKLFAWAIGVLIMLWMLTECLGGADETDPGYQDIDRDTQQYAADCEHAWQALDLAASADEATVDGVVDRVDALATEIADPNLKAIATGYAESAQNLVANADDDAALVDAESEFRDDAALDLSMRCPLR